MRKLVSDMKVIPGEEAALQYQRPVCDMHMAMPQKTKRYSWLKVWRLKDSGTCTRFQEVFKEHMLLSESEDGSTAEEVCAKFKTGLLIDRRQLGRSMALPVLTDCDVKIGGGVIKLKALLQLSDRHSRH